MPYESTVNKLIDAGLLVILGFVALIMAVALVAAFVLLLQVFRASNKNAARSLDLQQRQIDQNELTRQSIVRLDTNHTGVIQTLIELVKLISTAVKQTGTDIQGLNGNIKDHFGSLNKRIDAMSLQIDLILQHIISGNMGVKLSLEGEKSDVFESALDDYERDIEAAAHKLIEAYRLVQEARKQKDSNHDTQGNTAIVSPLNDGSSPTAV